MIKFISYTETPGEKHLGVAAISWDDKILLRYKVQLGKNGGTYLSPPAFKIGDSYVGGFIIDSNIIVDEIEKVIKDNIKKPTQAVDYHDSSLSNEDKVPF